MASLSTPGLRLKLAVLALFGYSAWVSYSLRSVQRPSFNGAHYFEDTAAGAASSWDRRGRGWGGVGGRGVGQAQGTPRSPPNAAACHTAPTTPTRQRHALPHPEGRGHDAARVPDGGGHHPPRRAGLLLGPRRLAALPLAWPGAGVLGPRRAGGAKRGRAAALAAGRSGPLSLSSQAPISPRGRPPCSRPLPLPSQTAPPRPLPPGLPGGAPRRARGRADVCDRRGPAARQRDRRADRDHPSRCGGHGRMQGCRALARRAGQRWSSCRPLATGPLPLQANDARRPRPPPPHRPGAPRSWHNPSRTQDAVFESIIVPGVAPHAPSLATPRACSCAPPRARLTLLTHPAPPPRPRRQRPPWASTILRASRG
jgi:hypothetical protein